MINAGWYKLAGDMLRPDLRAEAAAPAALGPAFGVPFVTKKVEGRDSLLIPIYGRWTVKIRC